MPSEKERILRGEHLSFYMDLVGHDVLNNNQAVLSYLELILASPSVDKNVRRYAEKAMSHARTSTLLVEDIKKIVSTRHRDLSALKPVSLSTTVERAERSAAQLFPSKKVIFDNDFPDKPAYAIGDDLASSILTNVLVDSIRMDQSDAASLEVKISEDMLGEREMWVVSVANRSIVLTQFADTMDLDRVFSEDSSRAVKMTGMIFAKMVTEMLGGVFEVTSMPEMGEKKGAIFRVFLRRTEGGP